MNSETRSSGTTRRAHLGAVAAAGGAAWLAACGPLGGAPDGRAATGQPAEIRMLMWGAPNDPYATGVEQALTQFRQKHPRITVTQTTAGGTGYMEKVSTEAAGNQASDVWEGWSFYPATWARQEITRDLEPYVKRSWKADFVRDFAAQSWSRYHIDKIGRFAVPFNESITQLYYNKDRFKERGVAVPDATWAWSKVQEAGPKLTYAQGEQQHWASNVDVNHSNIGIFVHGFGGTVVDPKDDLRCTLNDPRAIGGGEWYRDRMWRDNALTRPDQRQNVSYTNLFAQGRLAMILAGAWLLQTIDRSIGGNFDWDLAPVPKGPARRATHQSSNTWSIWKASKAPDAAWALVDYFESDEFWQINSGATTQEPPRKSLMPRLLELVRQKNPQLAGKSLNVFAEAKSEDYGYPEPLFRYHTEAMQFLTPAYASVFTRGEAPVADTFRSAATQVNDRMRQLGGGS
jgi:multiple sugar transport system substrate-binding protein